MIPNQYIKISKPPKTINSLEVKSVGSVFKICVEDPKRTFIQILKKNVGAIKYNKTIKKRHKVGKRSKKKLKNRISATNIIDPGKPKNTNVFTRATKKSLGHM